MFKKLLLTVFILMLGLVLHSCARPAFVPNAPAGQPPAGESQAAAGREAAGPVQDPASSGPEAGRPTQEASFRFAVFGDSKILPEHPQWQGNVVLSQIIGMINRDAPALVIYLGDGPDRGGPIENMRAFRKALEKLNPAWHPAIGNHEVLDGAGPDGKKGDGEENFISVFADKLPVQDGLGRKVSYYSFDYLESHFIVLDTAWPGSEKYGLFPGSSQWQWLVQDLEAARPKNRHIFVFGHQPPLNPSAPGYSWNNPKAAGDFLQLCRQYRVKAVFSGHYHAFKRFMDGDVTHIITGGGGAGLYAPPEAGGYFHYVLVTVTGDQVEYQVVRVK